MHRASCGFMPLCGITETLSDVESVRVVHNPFVIPEKVWLEDGSLYMLAGQSQWSGDYYSEELGKHPSGLYVSHDDGMSFEYVGEQ